MLNLGLIGDIKLLEPYIQKARQVPEVHIIGKSSVGTQPSPGSFRLQAPEFNRIELIERSDVLFINRFSLLPFRLLCDMVKKSKHIFAASYPNLSLSEINQLSNLALEAKTVIQFSNPFYYLPAVQWLNTILKKPSYAEVNYFNTDKIEENTLLQLLLMLKDMDGMAPKKTGAVSFSSTPTNSVFNNVQLEFSDGSAANLSYGNKEGDNQFRIRVFMRDRFAEIDITREYYTLNNLPVELSESGILNETVSFFNAILQKRKAVTNIETYSNAIQTRYQIQEKLERYFSF